MPQIPPNKDPLTRLKLFLALSRTPHGLIDMATPAFAALLWLAEFPPLAVIWVGLITTFAGYTAVYALNDIVDYRQDRKKIAAGGYFEPGGDLDAVLIRHPMARGYLSFSEGVAWTAFWSVVALAGAYWLNPVCVVIFLGGCLLEIIYCKLWNVTHLRTLISGAVKTSGAMAAVFAVDHSPGWPFLISLFLCLYFWEIGGQNIPNDWTDVIEDRRQAAKTIPVEFGSKRSTQMILITLVLAILMVWIAFGQARTPFAFRYGFMAIAVGVALLIMPALRLKRDPSRTAAMALFNRASYFPLALLAVVLLAFILGS